MTSLTAEPRYFQHATRDRSKTALTVAARFWFATAVIGQWIFVAYIMGFYGAAALRGDFEAWNKVFPRGHIAGDTLGNFSIGFHLLLAVLITLGGQLQLVPQVRALAPALHRWNGRVFLVAVVSTSLVGLYLVWGRGGSSGDLMQHLGISLDAVMILLCASLAVRHAMAGNIATHRRWALRLFMVVNAVWFFRVGLMFWLLVNNGPVGFDAKSFTGPFLSFLSFADVLLPLAVLELYLRAQEGGSVIGRTVTAALVVTLTLAMAIGVCVATIGMWLPHM